MTYNCTCTCRLEHVQEYTRALEESSDEEEDEEDDMPMTIKRPGEDSDKLSVGHRLLLNKVSFCWYW